MSGPPLYAKNTITMLFSFAFHPFPFACSVPLIRSSTVPFRKFTAKIRTGYSSTQTASDLGSHLSCRSSPIAPTAPFLLSCPNYRLHAPPRILRVADFKIILKILRLNLRTIQSLSFQCLFQFRWQFLPTGTRPSQNTLASPCAQRESLRH